MNKLIIIIAICASVFTTLSAAPKLKPSHDEEKLPTGVEKDGGASYWWGVDIYRKKSNGETLTRVGKNGNWLNEKEWSKVRYKLDLRLADAIMGLNDSMMQVNEQIQESNRANAARIQSQNDARRAAQNSTPQPSGFANLPHQKTPFESIQQRTQNVSAVNHTSYVSPQGVKLDSNKYEFHDLNGRNNGIDAIAIPKTQHNEFEEYCKNRKTGSLLNPDAKQSESLLTQFGGKK